MHLVVLNTGLVQYLSVQERFFCPDDQAIVGARYSNCKRHINSKHEKFETQVVYENLINVIIFLLWHFILHYLNVCSWWIQRGNMISTKLGWAVSKLPLSANLKLYVFDRKRLSHKMCMWQDARTLYCFVAKAYLTYSIMGLGLIMNSKL